MLSTVFRSFRISDVNLLTIEKQEKFLEIAKRFHNYFKYVLILETGLRTDEMIDLAWDAINFQDRTLTFNKTLEYIERESIRKRFSVFWGMHRFGWQWILMFMLQMNQWIKLLNSLKEKWRKWRIEWYKNGVNMA